MVVEVSPSELVLFVGYVHRKEGFRGFGAGNLPAAERRADEDFGWWGLSDWCIPWRWDIYVIGWVAQERGGVRVYSRRREVVAAHYVLRRGSMRARGGDGDVAEVVAFEASRSMTLGLGRESRMKRAGYAT